MPVKPALPLQETRITVGVEPVAARQRRGHRPPTSDPARENAETSISKVERGRWKFVTSRSTALKR